MIHSTWDKYFMDMARLVSTKSKDPSTQVGCVIVGEDQEIRSTGFNGFPRGVNESDPEMWERPTKYAFVEHAERNALYNAARVGVPLKGCTMYLMGPPCCDCARGLIQSGISALVYPEQNDFIGRHDWALSIGQGRSMLNEAGVLVFEKDL